MKCFNCQNEINEGDRFCGNCGAPLNQDPLPVQNVQAPQTVQPSPDMPAVPMYDYSRKRKKISGFVLMLIIVGTVVLAAVIAAVVILATSGSGGSDIDYPSIYDGLFNDEIYSEYSGSINTEITEVDGNKVIELTDEEYDSIDRIEVTAFAEYDGEYIYLGRDTIYNYDDYGNIIVDWDGTWLSVGGYIVSVYIQEEVYDEENDCWTTYGYIPFEYNESGFMEMVVCWDADNPDGYIMGYRYSGSDDLTDLLQFHETNTIAFASGICDANFKSTGSYVTSDTLIFGEMEKDIYYADISDVDICYYYTITDIYGDKYETNLLYYKAMDQEKLPWY